MLQRGIRWVNGTWHSGTQKYVLPSGNPTWLGNPLFFMEVSMENPLQWWIGSIATIAGGFTLNEVELCCTVLISGVTNGDHKTTQTCLSWHQWPETAVSLGPWEASLAGRRGGSEDLSKASCWLLACDAAEDAKTCEKCVIFRVISPSI